MVVLTRRAPKPVCRVHGTCPIVSTIQFSSVFRSLAVLALIWIACSPEQLTAQGQHQDRSVAPTIMITVGRPNIWTLETAHYLEPSSVITSATPDGSYKKWTIVDTPGKTLQSAVIVFKGAVAASSPALPVSQCPGFQKVLTPKKAPAAKKAAQGAQAAAAQHPAPPQPTVTPSPPK